jgi:hypothetical protein
VTRIHCLTQLYTPQGLLLDGDGDGQPDGFGVRFVIRTTPGAIDVAARLGLESAAFTPGFTTADAGGIALYFGPENPACPVLACPRGHGLVALTEAGVVVTGDTPETGWEAARWLAATYPYASPGGPLLADLAGGRPVTAVTMRGGAVVDLTLSDGSVTPVPDKATLTGAPEPPPFAAQAVGDLPPAGPAQLFTVAGLMGSSDTVQHDRAGWQVGISEAITPEEIAGLCELAARTGVEATGLRFPFAVALTEGAMPVADPRILLAARAPRDAVWTDGHLAWRAGALVVWGTPAERASALRAAAAAGLVDGLHATLFTRRAALPEERRPRGEVLFDLTLEHEWEVDRFRRTWRSGVLPRLQPGAPVAVDLRLSEPLAVREALAEEMAASLADAAIPQAHIRVLSAYKQGFHWLEEEVLPRLQGLPVARVAVQVARFSAPAGEVESLELPIRWLQELYPADELLGAALGAPVTFTLSEAAQTHIYEVTAYGADGAVLHHDTLDPVCSARDYLPDFPQRGRVHPPTGLLRVEQEGRLIAETALDTDLEAFWSVYQAEVLPRLRQAVLDLAGPVPDPAAQPFFGALVIEAALSEENRRLGIREEQISPLDALHEDLYFYTLDYVNELGLKLAGKGYAAPGGIEPWVVAGEGGPLVRIRLYALPPAESAATADSLPAQAAPDLPAPAEGGIPADTIIGPHQLPAYLAYLGQLPGVRVWRTGLSFGGRATWAVSVTAPTTGSIAPPQKLSAWRPTLLVNARHHANEVSSTNGVLRLAESAAKHGWAAKVNLVISPLENVDGAALHYAMQEVHPHWKLHAARFNAAGVEFYSEWFAAEPKYGEARPLPTLWRATLPDVVLDDHGYPSHEWVQPFSGYNSPPYFKTSWWMPNALIYAIHRWMDGAQFPAHGAVQEGIRAALAQWHTHDPVVSGYTATLLDRYVTLGRQYVPEKFPLEMHDGFIALTPSAAPGPESRTFVGRFPHITAAELVTEVPDETAQGDYLDLCVHAHYQADRAVLHYLARRPQPVVRRRWEQDGFVYWSAGRERPLQAMG